MLFFLLHAKELNWWWRVWQEWRTEEEQREQMKLRLLMRQGPDIQYDYTTKCWYTQNHTHMPPSSSWERCRWQQSLAYSLFTHQTDISFRHIRTHTIKTLSLQCSTWCATLRTQRSKRFAASGEWTHQYAQKKTQCSAMIISILTHQHFSFQSDYATQWTL